MSANGRTRPVATFSQPWPERLAMRPPVGGVASSSFGLRRVFNGQPRSPRTAAWTSPPPRAPGDGAGGGPVIDTGDYFLQWADRLARPRRGLAVDDVPPQPIDVKPGDDLKVGERLGAVGATGRVTGPHLHRSVMPNRASIDPALLLFEVAPGVALRHHRPRSRQGARGRPVSWSAGRAAGPVIAGLGVYCENL